MPSLAESKIFKDMPPSISEIQNRAKRIQTKAKQERKAKEQRARRELKLKSKAHMPKFNTALYFNGFQTSALNVNEQIRQAVAQIGQR